MEYIIGIDQGGTKTIVALSDIEGNILDVGYSYGSCYSINGMEHAMDAIKFAFEGIKTEINMDDIVSVSCGLTGADFPFEYALLRENVSKTLGINLEKINVVNDCVIALRGGSSSPYGAVICAGTGINCAFINKEGKELVLGYYIDDEFQGGSSIGRKAISSIFHSEICIEEKTVLTERILKYYNVATVDELQEKYIFDNDLKFNAKVLVPLIFKAAEENDAVAIKVLQYFGYHWARFVIAGVRKLSMDYPFELVISGGVFKAESDILINSFTENLKKEIGEFSIVEAKYEPIVGAVLLALDKMNTVSREKIDENISKSAIANNLIRKN